VLTLLVMLLVMLLLATVVVVVVGATAGCSNVLPFEGRSGRTSSGTELERLCVVMENGEEEWR
jgi:hypothetical protein